MAANNITTIAFNHILSITQQCVRDNETGWRKETQFPYPHASIDLAILLGLQVTNHLYEV